MVENVWFVTKVNGGVRYGTLVLVCLLQCMWMVVGYGLWERDVFAMSKSGENNSKTSLAFLYIWFHLHELMQKNMLMLWIWTSEPLWAAKASDLR